MAVYTHVPAEVMADFLAGYDVGTLVSAKGIAEGVENSNYLIETSGADGQGARFILTLYEKRVATGDLPFFMTLLDHLAARGLPVPPALPDRTGQVIRELMRRPACLIRFLPGISVTHPTAAQARAAGSAMGAMHRAVADFPLGRANNMGLDTWSDMLSRCGHAGMERIAPGLWGQMTALLRQVQAHWPHNLPKSVIHADLFPDNVLMLDDQVTGLIDFYFACTDIRVYDLAVMHSAWAFAPDGTPADPAIGQALIAGYETTHGLTKAERAALPLLAQGACIRFLLSRAYDWINTPADALVTRKDPLAYWHRLEWYCATGKAAFA
jgi:homoserine kinase type II